MKDDNKKSRAEEIIRMIRAKKAVEDISIRDIANAMRDQDKEEEDETNTQQILKDMFDPFEDEDQHKIIVGPSIGRTAKESFHNFEQVDIAINAMGLYRSIMEEIELENDPKVLKAFFAERLGQVLEAIPDGIASAIDCNIKGLD